MANNLAKKYELLTKILIKCGNADKKHLYHTLTKEQLFNFHEEIYDGLNIYYSIMEKDTKNSREFFSRILKAEDHLTSSLFEVDFYMRNFKRNSTLIKNIFEFLKYNYNVVYKNHNKIKM